LARNPSPSGAWGPRKRRSVKSAISTLGPEVMGHMVSQIQLGRSGRAEGSAPLPSDLLRDPDAKLVHIALDVGYDSEAAFSRAFKRLVGLSPGAWRKERRGIS
jgi:hypothetical protein